MLTQQLYKTNWKLIVEEEPCLLYSPEMRDELRLQKSTDFFKIKTIKMEIAKNNTNLIKKKVKIRHSFSFVYFLSNKPSEHKKKLNFNLTNDYP